MAENNRAKHAFGALERIDEAIVAGTIDAYDILFLKDADGNPYVGWIDALGNKVIVPNGNDAKEIVVVEDDSLPTTGETNKLYVFGGQIYIWNGTEFINTCKPTDLTDLENKVNTKVNADTVQTMIEEYADSAIEIVEF